MKDKTTTPSDDNLKAAVLELLTAGDMIAGELAESVNADDEAYEESRDTFGAWEKAVRDARSLITP